VTKVRAGNLAGIAASGAASFHGKGFGRRNLKTEARAPDGWPDYIPKDGPIIHQERRS